MAKKDGILCSCKVFVLYIIINVATTSAFVATRYACMSTKRDTFEENHCLSDSYMRTILSVYFTIITIVLASAISEATCAYRTLKLKEGINEGVYVAMMSRSPSCIFMSMKTRWSLIIVFIMATWIFPQMIQPLSNIGIKSVNVYIPNESTAAVYSKESLYNADLSANRDITSSVVALSQLRKYSGGLSSVIKDGRVETTVLRSGFVTASSIVDGDISNCFKYNETAAIVGTECDQEQHYGQNVNTFATAGSLMNKRVILTDEAKGLARVDYQIYDLAYENGQFNATYITAVCYNVTTTSNGCISDAITVTKCKASAQLGVYEIIYTVATGNIGVIRLVSNLTTVDIGTFTNVLANISNSISTSLYNPPQQDSASENDPCSLESNPYAISVGLYEASAGFEQGLFNNSNSNLCHARISSAASITLGYLWANQVANKESNIRNAVLSSIGIKTYIGTLATWIIAGSIVGCTVITCVFGAAATVMCPINVKDSNETSLMNNIDNDTLLAKRINRASNDNSKQRKESFNNVLYCREEQIHVNFGKHTQTLRIGYNPNGVIPSRHVHYE